MRSPAPSARRRIVRGDAPLHAAARDGKLAALRAALDAGACIDAVNTAGATALILAAERGDLSACRLLVERGARLEIASRHGVTALYMAVHGGHCDVADFLLDRGARVDVIDRWGKPMLAWAAQNADGRMFHRLLRIVDGLPSPGAQLRHALHWAVLAVPRADLAIVGTLLDRGLDVHARNDRGDTVLDILRHDGATDALKALLLDKGIDIEAAQPIPPAAPERA